MAAMLLTLLASAPAALADGAATVAGATAVAFGQQQFGNTRTGGTSGIYSRSWWQVNLATGDQLTLDWETSGSAVGTVPWVEFFAPGLKDNVVLQTRHLADSYASPNNAYKAELTYTATAGGAFPLEFVAQQNLFETGPYGGPYDFMASVLHAVSLGVPTLASLTSTGSVAVGVHAPDGSPLSDPAISVSFQASLHGTGAWATVGSAAPAAGTASISYTIPDSLRGEKVDVRAVSIGAGYIDATSNVQTVDGPPAPVVYGRAVTISRSRGAYHGRVSAAAPECKANVLVTLYRKGQGGRVYGSARTTSTGSWKIASRALKGKIYASIASASVGLSTCANATSRALSR